MRRFIASITLALTLAFGGAVASTAVNAEPAAAANYCSWSWFGWGSGRNYTAAVYQGQTNHPTCYAQLLVWCKHDNYNLYAQIDGSLSMWYVYDWGYRYLWASCPVGWHVTSWTVYTAYL